jgi:hypothetical protein
MPAEGAEHAAHALKADTLSNFREGKLGLFGQEAAGHGRPQRCDVLRLAIANICGQCNMTLQHVNQLNALMVMGRGRTVFLLPDVLALHTDIKGFKADSGVLFFHVLTILIVFVRWSVVFAIYIIPHL